MKTQYKAIIASAVVVMLCLSAIGGITYSWFSDSEQSEINVTTGKIDLKVDTSDVKVKSYNGSSKDVTGTTDTDVGGKVKVTTNSGTATLSIDFNGAVPGDELSFKATISMFSTIKTVYSESATVSMNGSAVSKHPFTITGLNTSSVPYGPIGTSAVYEQIGEKTVTIKFNSGSDDNEWMGKTFKIQLKFEAYQSNAPVYDSITETISEGTNTIGVFPSSTTSESAKISFDGSADIKDKKITVNAIDTADATYALSGSSPLAGISVNSDASFVGKAVNVSFVLPGNVPKNELTITHNGDTVWNGSTGTITVDATYDVATGTTTVSFTTELGFSYYAVYNNNAAIIGSNGKTYNQLADAVKDAKSGATITVLKDCNDQKQVQILNDRSIVIDCNNHTITFSNGQFAGVCTSINSDLKYINGTLNVNAGGSFYAANGAKITIDNIAVNVPGYGFFPCGNGTSISINNSIINSKEFGIGTNASDQNNYGVNISIINSTLKSDDTPIMLNVTGDLTVKNSELIGGNQCLFLRAGTATVENTIMKFSKVNTTIEEEILTWGSNGEDGIPFAAIIVGNLTSTAYNADAKLTISNSKVITESDECITLLVAQDGRNGYGASVTIVDSPSILDYAFKTTGNTLESVDKGTTSIEIPKM